MELKKKIRGVFELPKKKIYFGPVAIGCPYFFPRNYCGSIIKIRRLKLKTKEESDEYVKKYPHLKESLFMKFSNVPMVRRNNNFIKKIFGNYYLIEMGYPTKIAKVELGWKDKHDSPRFEWAPQFHIYFFVLQFAIFWNSPDGDNDTYYEMILHYLYYSDKDINKAEKTWPWQNFKTKKSTWNNKYLINDKN